MDKARSFHNKDPICCWVSEIGNSQTIQRWAAGWEVIVGGARQKARGGFIDLQVGRIARQYKAVRIMPIDGIDSYGFHYVFHSLSFSKDVG